MSFTLRHLLINSSTKSDKLKEGDQNNSGAIYAKMPPALGSDSIGISRYESDVAAHNVKRAVFNLGKVIHRSLVLCRNLLHSLR